MPQRIQHKIKEVRESLMLSQERFGKKIGVSGKTISAYENGRAKPSLKVLDAISNIYNVPIVKIRKTQKTTFFHRITRIKKSLTELEEILKQSISL